MPKPTSPYPKLEYYLFSVRVADHIYAAKRLENWARWSVLPVILLGALNGWYWLGVAYVCLMFPLGYWLWRRRIGANTNAQALAMESRANISSRIRRPLKSGNLAGRIGEDGAAALERCATFAVAAMSDQARATMFALGPTGQLELRREISARAA